MDPLSIDSTFVDLVVVLGPLALIFVVHDLGHYAIAGLAGVPASDRRIVFSSFPPYVALPVDGEWVSPFEHDQFSAAYGRYDPQRRYAPLFTAGGFLGQIAIVPVALTLEVATGHPIGHAIVTTSVGFTVVYLGYDLVVAARQRSAYGDTTHLWRLSPWYALGIHAAFFGTHGIALLAL